VLFRDEEAAAAEGKVLAEGAPRTDGLSSARFAKALALEDESGNRLVVVTLDLIGVPQALRRQDLYLASKASLIWRGPEPLLLGRMTRSAWSKARHIKLIHSVTRL
jgi:hypothetical protein